MTDADANVELEPHEAPDGTTVYVDRRTADRGSDGPFYHVYETRDRETRWGYRCGACGSFDTAMDTMGRIACTRCPNRRKPDEWDAVQG